MAEAGPRWQPRGVLRRLFRGACLALSALVLGIWTIVVFTADDPGVWQRDWAFLREAGQALIQGRLGSVYTTDWSGLGSGHYWLYPPFALWGAAMLAVLPPAPTYAGVLLTQGALAAFVLRHACALGPHAGVERRIDFAFGVLASAPAASGCWPPSPTGSCPCWGSWPSAV
jgi:hypothetical protein